MITYFAPRYGTITLTFADCENGTLAYNFPGAGLSGTIPLSRVAPDNVSLCERLSGTGEQ